MPSCYFRSSNCPHVTATICPSRCYNTRWVDMMPGIIPWVWCWSQRCITLVHECIFCTGSMPLPGGLPPFSNLPNPNIILPNASQVLPPAVGGQQHAGIVLFYKTVILDLFKSRPTKIIRPSASHTLTSCSTAYTACKKLTYVDSHLNHKRVSVL